MMIRRSFQVVNGGGGGVLVAVMFLLLQQSYAVGEGMSGRTRSAGPVRVVPMRPSRIFQLWVDKLDLSDDQQEQIAPIVFKMFQEIEMWRQDESMTSDQHIEMIRRLRIQANKKIRSFLTATQLRQFDKLQKQLSREIERKPGGRPYNEQRQEFDPGPAPGGPPLSGFEEGASSGPPAGTGNGFESAPAPGAGGDMRKGLKPERKPVP